jgi:hypothetical protein
MCKIVFILSIVFLMSILIGLNLFRFVCRLRDARALQLRGYIDPKRNYKKEKRANFGKQFFQVKRERVCFWLESVC